MNTLFAQLTSISLSITIKSARSVGSSLFYGTCSNLSYNNKSRSNILRKSSNLGTFALSRFEVIQCCYYSTKKGSTRKRKVKVEPVVMEDEKEAFFVVRKGDVVGVYKSLSDCQTQVGSSVIHFIRFCCYFIRNIVLCNFCMD